MLLYNLLKRQSPATARYDWILAITFIAYLSVSAVHQRRKVMLTAKQLFSLR